MLILKSCLLFNFLSVLSLVKIKNATCDFIAFAAQLFSLSIFYNILYCIKMTLMIKKFLYLPRHHRWPECPYRWTLTLLRTILQINLFPFLLYKDPLTLYSKYFLGSFGRNVINLTVWGKLAGRTSVAEQIQQRKLR